MANYALKLPWILLLFSILCPLEILGQYAHPTFVPSWGQINPATIAWLEKDSITISRQNEAHEHGNPKYANEAVNSTAGLWGYIGKTFGLITNFELLISQEDYEETVLNEDRETSQSSQIFEKTAGVALGFLSVGYTDIGETKFYRAYRDSDSSQIDSSDYEIQKKGITIDLSKIGSPLNIFLGAFQRDVKYKNYIRTNKYTSSSGTVTTKVYNRDDYTKSEIGKALAIVLGESGKNRMRFEIFQWHSDKILYSENVSEDGGTPETRQSDEPAEEYSGATFETIFNGYTLQVEQFNLIVKNCTHKVCS